MALPIGSISFDQTNALAYRVAPCLDDGCIAVDQSEQIVAAKLKDVDSGQGSDRD